MQQARIYNIGTKDSPFNIGVPYDKEYIDAKLEQTSRETPLGNGISQNTTAQPRNSLLQKVVFGIILLTNLTSLVPQSINQNSSDSQSPTSTGITEGADSPLVGVPIYYTSKTESNALAVTEIVNEIQNSNEFGKELMQLLTSKGTAVRFKNLNTNKEYADYNNDLFAIYDPTLNEIHINTGFDIKNGNNRVELFTHEALHAIQKDILYVIGTLPPIESIIMRLIIELDAQCRAYMITHYEEGMDISEIFYQMCNRLSNGDMNNYLEHYLSTYEKLIEENKGGIAKYESLSNQELLEKLNINEFSLKYPSVFFNDKMTYVWNSIPNEYKTLFKEMENEYFANITHTRNGILQEITVQYTHSR